MRRVRYQLGGGGKIKQDEKQLATHRNGEAVHGSLDGRSGQRKRQFVTIWKGDSVAELAPPFGLELIPF